MPLALDYRPKTLDELAGNVATKKSLGSILRRPLKDIPRCYLFSGIKGGGKTTLGYIIANVLKCDPFELYDINAANFRGVEHAKELGNRTVRYPPMKGPVRIWMFQEVHKWTNDAQNAMLDTMEKLPPYCIFVLTTTDPQKLIAPLRSRCIEYEVLPLSDNDMFNMLVNVVEAEKADVPDFILEKILAVAAGSSRNALQLLEKVIDLDPKEMASVAMVMDDDAAVTKDLIDALLKKEPWKNIASILKRINEEPETVRWNVLNYVAAILLNGKDNKQAALILEYFSCNFYDSGKAGLVRACYSIIL
jgi:DNA polymerase III subunit gamma/tau